MGLESGDVAGGTRLEVTMQVSKERRNRLGVRAHHLYS